ncbi:glutamate dehydrogenase (NAD) [Methylobacter tundripaludum]|uniref:Glutamate dehydrogenase (NAD) n=1 Tax=Methylobacter tundripaludum TaxID=173365 RepID=A0A2S6GSM0_9GAMM|nr:NAD-glutamate dehydrogenase domain-containing protein [Methylobacter tundripaludum]PPK68242.1 glutamate dehydrogenase (NAD) [Methylobacter tundripaludum]
MNRPSKTWPAALQRIAERALGKQAGHALWQKYHATFSAAYRAQVSPRYALKDMLYLDEVLASCAIPSSASCRQRISLLSPGKKTDHYRLHFYSLQPRYLDEYIPVLENMHLRIMDQVQFPVTVAGTTLFIKSFTIKAAKSQCASFAKLRCRMLETIQMMMDGMVENDALSKLCVLIGMTWQEIDVLRAYRNYFLQLGHQTTRASVHHALLNNPQAALGLFNYFEVRFRPNPDWDDPMIREEQALFPLRLQLLSSIASVSDINDDRILRTLFNLIDATMRCNFHLRRDRPDYFIAFKINSLGIIDMPSPKPQNEIYVHSVDMEAIHLRNGKISRGGIRWSDRPDDFRTEILGLMQTQISKNALIIPTGAKGGFVLKKSGLKHSLSSNGLDVKEAAKKAYLTFIRGLLDLTDNYVDDRIVQPNSIVCYDNPDPYLVVAADKGTAQFSDSANAVSAEYQFWLGDAFASGGSHGYDHKALGITARGAWECVKRHFRELDKAAAPDQPSYLRPAGKDIQHEAFTVVGIGSMDGDVFGNGMLMSPYIRLLAAFSGSHIFIDPNPPDGDAAFNERKRLFELPGSSWNDYDRTLISAGGGVYPRSAKDIPVSAELKKWLGIRYKTLDGESLVRYLLTAQVELLWLGGIGTYVKAGTEKNEEVGDRANDNVRVNAADLRAGIVGEGANLGFTQKARIEYGLKGGRINTDAVDNSAGVDSSDHEVNLKIFLTGLQKKGLIADYQPLFISMTEEVCRLVLADNIAQSLCLSLEQLRCKENPAVFLQLAEQLESAGSFDRAAECFPHVKDVMSRPGQLITRPELAVLMAASKMHLTQLIQDQSALLQEECCTCYLQAYFPKQLATQYADQLSSHPLAGEIKATLISNKIINQAGCGFLSLAADSDGTLDHVTCYLTFDRVLDGDALRQAINALDHNAPVDKQYRLLMQLETTLAGFCRWALMQRRKIRPNDQTINCYKRYLKGYKQYFKTDCSEFAEQLAQYRQDGIPEQLALDMAFIASLDDFPLIVSLAAETAQDFVTTLKLFNEITGYLGLYPVYDQLAKLPMHDYWERKVLNELQEDIKRMVGLTIKAILASKAESCTDYFDRPDQKHKISRYRRIYQEINSAVPVNLFPYIALAKELQHLVGVDPVAGKK